MCYALPEETSGIGTAHAELTVAWPKHGSWSDPVRHRALAARRERCLQPFDVKPNTPCPYHVSLTKAHIEVMWVARWKARRIVAQRDPALVVIVHI